MTVREVSLRVEPCVRDEREKKKEVGVCKEEKLVVKK